MLYYDMSIHQGEGFDEMLLLVNNKGKAINLAGKEVKAQIRPEPGHATLIANITTQVFPEEGRINIKLTGTQTQNFAVGTYHYDVCSLDNGTIKYYIGGKFIVLPRVSREA